MENNISITLLEQMPQAINGLAAQLTALQQQVALITACSPAAASTTTGNGYITRREAAARLRISLPTLHTYTLAGKLQAYRLGSRVFYKAAELENCLQTINPTAHS